MAVEVIDRAALRFQVGGVGVTVQVRPRDSSPAWFCQGGWALNVETEAPTPEPVRTFLRELRAAFTNFPDPDGIDAGDAARAGTDSSGGRSRQRSNVLRPASTALARELDRAAYLAARIIEEEERLLPTVLRHDGERTTPWRTMIIEEIYPYVGALGSPLSREEVLTGWERTAEMCRRGAAPDAIGLYVHVPFCTRRCHFCYCAVSTDLSDGISEKYVEHLVDDITAFGRAVRGLPVRTIYAGGGTPSVLPPRLLERLFGAIHEHFAVERDAQITIETNPDSLTREKLETLRSVARMTRLTMGIQSVDPETQRRMDRHNDPARIRRLVDDAREIGVPVLNLDFIAGLDGQTIEAFERDIAFGLSLRPDSFSLGPFRPLHVDTLDPDPEQLARRQAMLTWGHAQLAEHGLLGRNNLPASCGDDGVNEQIQHFHHGSSSLLGFGASAYGHSFGGHFYEQPFDLTLTQLRRGGAPPGYRGLSAQGSEEIHRFLVHGFFSRELRRSVFKALFGCEPWDAVPEAWQCLVELGRVEVRDDVVRFLISSYSEHVALRVLLFSPVVRERCEARWGADYDGRVDHVARLEAICRYVD